MCAKEAAMVCVMVNFGGTMTHPIESRLAGLPELSRTALCDLWKEHFGTSPPTQLRRNLMIPILAHRIQERAFGSLSAGTQKRLRELAEGFANHSEQIVMSKPSLKPGTRLVREWRDQVHLVNVEANGYEYKGGRYKSLSQIARLITGTRWSGPVFFGIKSESAKDKSKEVIQ
jgi:Protein of unknown function (DUF2924)